MFLQTAEEHLHQLRVVFNFLREYNLKLKPLKCSLFREENRLLGSQGVQRRHSTQSHQCESHSQIYTSSDSTEIRAFLGLVGHYRHFIKGFAQIDQQLNEHLA